MSDTNVAPAAAPAPQAPLATEVPVNPNPTNVPSPIGAQAPDKPVGDLKGSEHRPESRREAIQKAFDRARTENPPQAAKPRIGHNNPPEETKVERRAKDDRPAPVDLRKRPVDQPQREPPQRAEHGHFAPRQADADRSSGVQQNGQQQPSARQAPALPVGAPYAQPPQRMTDRAKAEWATTPESVRADVHRMHQEFGRAYQQYRGDHETMNTIRPFAKMAHEHGTTLERALSNYVGMENKLRSDVVGGLDVIIHNLNLRTPDGRQLTLPDVAWHIVNQTPEQRALLQSKNTAMAQSHQLQAAHQRIAALETHVRQAQYAQHFTHTRSGVDQYAATHPRLDELGDLIEQEVKLGFDLDTAYRRAELLRPAHAAQTRSTTAQTRPTDRSIHGAPSGPSNGQARPRQQVGRRDAIANAIKRVNGSL